jgi:hypothetical protein
MRGVHVEGHRDWLRRVTTVRRLPRLLTRAARRARPRAASTPDRDHWSRLYKGTARAFRKVGMVALCIAMLVILSGCKTWVPNRPLQNAVDRGDFAAARELVNATLTRNMKDRNYALDRLRLGMIDMGDGQVTSAEGPLLAMYDLMRQQGINDDQTLAAAFAGTGSTTVWKGEPFEQALAYAFLAMQTASVDDWGNTRAAAKQSLFLLKNFGNNKSREQIAEDAARAKDGDDYLDHGYTPEPTNFALGYFLNAVANLALADADRTREAEDNFRTAAKYSPALQPVGDALLAGQANTVLIVAYGRGPEKVRYGYHEALAEFRVTRAVPTGSLNVSVQGGSSVAAGQAERVSAMASSHMWNNLQDLRVAMAAIGDAAMVGGIVAATQSSDTTVQAAGVGLAIAGAVLAENQRADLRYCEIMPEQFHAAAVNITQPNSTVTLTVGGSRIVLPAMNPPAAPNVMQFRFVWVPSLGGTQRWMTSGRLTYRPDDVDRHVPGDDLPYILGGTCVRTPSSESLSYYQSKGNLQHITPVELENLYREEGLVWAIEDTGGVVGRHVLEGGKSLVAPLPGTTGFARLYCQPHQRYPGADALRARFGLPPLHTPPPATVPGGQLTFNQPRSLP